MFATRRTELGKEHIRPIQVGGESFDMNIPPPRGGANRRCDCDGYCPDTLEIEISPLRWYTMAHGFQNAVRGLRFAVNPARG